MGLLEATRAELGLAVLYLNKAEARDKICRAIQYGSKFISIGQPGTAQNVHKSTTLACKVFRLLKWVNDQHALISLPAKGTPLTLASLDSDATSLDSDAMLIDRRAWRWWGFIVPDRRQPPLRQHVPPPTGTRALQMHEYWSNMKNQIQ